MNSTESYFFIGSNNPNKKKTNKKSESLTSKAMQQFFHNELKDIKLILDNKNLMKKKDKEILSLNEKIMSKDMIIKNLNRKIKNLENQQEQNLRNDEENKNMQSLSIKEENKSENDNASQKDLKSENEKSKLIKNDVYHNLPDELKAILYENNNQDTSKSGIKNNKIQLDQSKKDKQTNNRKLNFNEKVLENNIEYSRDLKELIIDLNHFLKDFIYENFNINKNGSESKITINTKLYGLWNKLYSILYEINGKLQNEIDYKKLIIDKDKIIKILQHENKELKTRYEFNEKVYNDLKSSIPKIKRREDFNSFFISDNNGNINDNTRSIKDNNSKINLKTENTGFVDNLMIEKNSNHKTHKSQVLRLTDNKIKMNTCQNNKIERLDPHKFTDKSNNFLNTYLKLRNESNSISNLNEKELRAKYYSSNNH